MQGGKKKRRGKKNNNSDTKFTSPTESQYYARVNQNMGNCRFNLDVFYYIYKTENISAKKQTINHDMINPNDLFFKMETKVGSVRGKMMRRQYVNMGDIILVSKRDFQDSVVDIIHVYKNDHYHHIRKCKFAPPELFNGVSNGDINFEESDSNSDDDSETIEYSSNKKENKDKPKQSYMESLALPDYDFNEEDETEGKEQQLDTMGNFI